MVIACAGSGSVRRCWIDIGWRSAKKRLKAAALSCSCSIAAEAVDVANDNAGALLRLCGILGAVVEAATCISSWE
jgi:hypothetical protein